MLDNPCSDGTRQCALEEEFVKDTVKPSVEEEKFAVGTEEGMGGKLASSW